LHSTECRFRHPARKSAKHLYHIDVYNIMFISRIWGIRRVTFRYSRHSGLLGVNSALIDIDSKLSIFFFIIYTNTHNNTYNLRDRQWFFSPMFIQLFSCLFFFFIFFMNESRIFVRFYNRFVYACVYIIFVLCVRRRPTRHDGWLSLSV